MHPAVVFRVLGVLLMVFSLAMLPPALVAMHYKDSGLAPFLFSFLLLFSVGTCFWFPFRRRQTDLRIRDGFLVVVLFWTVLGCSGAAPLLLDSDLNISFTDSVFEAVSGLTTTGATVITGLDHLPPSILFYRQQLQWLGGMGIIVLAVAILPMLGIGGMQLYRAEAPGPVKDAKLTPRITETAKALWYIYLWLTILCATSYYMAGMGLFDAIGHSFSTIAIGGFSTHDASIGYFNNPNVEMVCMIFMFLSAVNFGLHFVTWRHTGITHYIQDSEFKFFVKMLLSVMLVVCLYLLTHNVYDNWTDAIRHGMFQSVSIMTTTGYTTDVFSAWPSFVPFLLIISSFIGGCAGSTAGGIKAVRVLLIIRQGAREVKRLIHPSSVVLVKLNKTAVSDRIIEAVWGFFAVYITSFAILVVVVMATGLDFETAFSAVAACLNNLGPGLGDVSAHYGDINNSTKWVLCLAMLLGRLEIFTLLVLFNPDFWRK